MARGEYSDIDAERADAASHHALMTLCEWKAQ